MKTSLRLLAIGAMVVCAFCFGRSVAEFPELNAAKQKLLGAKTNLENAAKEFGGHRVKAIEATEKAIKEIDEAILYGDKK
jgi:hypothetical protein